MTEQLPLESLNAWLGKNIPECKVPIRDVVQFRGGQSNPTFKLVDSAGRSFVLRKKPSGKLLQKAHQVDREYRVLNALSKTSVPVPRVYGLCTDDSVLGVSFYVMEFLEGRILRNFDGIAPQERREMQEDMARVLALLHSVSWKSIGLEGFGAEGNYYRRQLRVWGDQWQQSKVEDRPVPSMEELATFLGDRMQEQRRACIVHGDFRLENMMFHPNAPRIVGVLDWEIATIGDPRADIAYCAISYHFGGLHGEGHAEGLPTEEEFLNLYCNYSHQPYGISNWGWHLAFSCFRLASIAAGVYKRALQGNASDGKAALRFADTPRLLSELGLALGKNLGNKTIGAAQQQSDSHDNKGKQLLFDPKRVWFASTTNRSAYTNEQLRQTASLLPFSDRGKDMLCAVNDFMNEHIFPAEGEYIKHHHESPWSPNPVIERLKLKAKHAGLWNLFLSSVSKFTNLEYARMAEVMGQVFWASEVFNCSAPDTGNMEILHLFGTPEQKEKWLKPLLDGTIRSCFGMTEPDVASSDARNICLTIARSGSNYVLNGRKWYISGAGDPRCKICIVMGKIEGSENAPGHLQQSMVLVPMNTPGLKLVRACGVFGQDDSPHGHMEIVFDNVVVDAAKSILWGEGKGFAISQARLGPGRIHHCMRSIGVAERALQAMIERASNRKVFGGTTISRANVQDVIAESALEIEESRLLTLQAAHMIDVSGSKGAFQHIAMIKISAPRMSLRVIDRAIQIFGAEGLSQDSWLSYAYAGQRTLRLADGPDEVHLMTLAKIVISRQKKRFESKL